MACSPRGYDFARPSVGSFGELTGQLQTFCEKLDDLLAYCMSTQSLELCTEPYGFRAPLMEQTSKARLLWRKALRTVRNIDAGCARAEVTFLEATCASFTWRYQRVCIGIKFAVFAAWVGRHGVLSVVSASSPFIHSCV